MKKTEKLNYYIFLEGYFWPLPLHEEYKIIPCKHEASKENRTSPHRVF